MPRTDQEEREEFRKLLDATGVNRYEVAKELRRSHGWFSQFVPKRAEDDAKAKEPPAGFWEYARLAVTAISSRRARAAKLRVDEVKLPDRLPF